MKKSLTIICALLAVFMRFCAAAEDVPKDTIPSLPDEWVTTATTETYPSQETQVQTAVPEETTVSSVPDESESPESQETMSPETTSPEPNQDENMGDWA